MSEGLPINFLTFSFSMVFFLFVQFTQNVSFKTGLNLANYLHQFHEYNDPISVLDLAAGSGGYASNIQRHIFSLFVSCDLVGFRQHVASFAHVAILKRFLVRDFLIDMLDMGMHQGRDFLNQRLHLLIMTMYSLKLNKMVTNTDLQLHK